VDQTDHDRGQGAATAGAHESLVGVVGGDREGREDGDGLLVLTHAVQRQVLVLTHLRLALGVLDLAVNQRRRDVERLQDVLARLHSLQRGAHTHSTRLPNMETAFLRASISLWKGPEARYMPPCSSRT